MRCGFSGGSNLVGEEEPRRCGPGAYRPAPAEGSPRLEDLPAPPRMRRQRHATRPRWPPCGPQASRAPHPQRLLPARGALRTGRPQALQRTSAPSSSPPWRGACTPAWSALAPPHSASTPRVLALARRRGGAAGGPDRPARGPLGRATGCACPVRRGRTGARRGDNQAEARLGTAWLAGALADCAGDGAVDAWDAGPCGVRSAVAQRRAQRLLADGLDHPPRPAARRAGLGRRHSAVEARALTRRGGPTEGAPRSPAPRRDGGGAGPPHRGACQGGQARVHAGRSAVARARQAWAAPPPPWPQGRPSTTAAPHAARKPTRWAQRGAAGWTPWPLVRTQRRRHRARRRWWRRTRGLPQGRQGRASREPGDAWCDRRGRRQTALAKRTTPRRRRHRGPPRGARLPTLWAPPLEQAVVVRADTGWPSTSQAVERGHRRSRKRPKSLARVRTHEQMTARRARAMGREAPGAGRDQTRRA